MTKHDRQRPFGRALLAAVVLLATGASWAAGEAATVPFTINNGDIVFDVDLGSGQALPFAFDSGLTAGNIITARAARGLGLEVKGHAHFTDSSGQRGGMPVAAVDTLRVGTSELHDQRFAIARVPDRLVARGDQPPIAGFLGAPLMQGAVVCIDYRHNELRRWPETAFQPGGRRTLAMKTRHGLQTVHVSIDGVDAVLAVDTGHNGGVALFPSFAEPHHLRDKYPDLQRGRGLSGPGKSFDVYTGTAQSVRLGDDTTLRDVPLALVPQAFNPAWGIDGLAGYALLRRLNPCLDPSGGRLLWSASGS